MPPQDRTTIHIRIPTSLLKRLKIAAADGERSMNAEVAARLERSFSDDHDDRTRAVKMLGEALSLLDKGSKA